MREQVQILRFIENKLERFSLLEFNAQAAIELLIERCTALISAAVTGKIDVRGWKRPNSDARFETEMDLA